MSPPHLNVQTSYSLLSSLITFEQYFIFAKQQQLSSLAICDDNMFGVFEFHKMCLANNVKPLLGLNFNVLYNNQEYNLQLFAKNQKGYFKLVEITSLIMNDTEKDAIILLTSIEKFLTSDLKIIINYSQANYDSSLYSQFENGGLSSQDLFLGLNCSNIALLSLFQELVDSKQIIWTNKVQYLFEDDFLAFKVIDTIRLQILFKDNNIKNLTAWKNAPEKYQQYYDNIDYFIASIEIYLLKHDEISDSILAYPTPENISAREYLKGICQKGLEFKCNQKGNIEYLDRLRYELTIIDQMGFNDYFLIVWDYVAFAKKNNIFVGPGRGSAAGSLVSYLLDITTIDPIAYNLLFERFLNPERKSLPDIDIDFEDNKREMIVEYLFKKYGQDHVGHIVTFQTMGIKMAIRDICRIFSINSDEVDKMSKAVGIENNFNYEQAILQNPVLKYYQEIYPQVFLYLPKLIGLPRQTGTHAAGIVLTKQRLQTILPVKEGYNGIYQTQYSMNFLEELGIIKMDLLGLRNLTILHDVVNKIYLEKKEIIILEKLPLDDKKTYALLAQGDTKGIFQLESMGMTKVLVDMEPNNLEDIVATSSLYRPGPQDHIPTFINRKKGLEKIEYIDLRLKEILESTYGIILYQEQVMLIAQKVANFSLAKADVLRRAMGKKDTTIMDAMRIEFIQKSIANQYNEKVAKLIWDLIYKFASYGFNRSHAVAYSLLGYQIAYLKANYPSQFLASLLTHVIGDENKTNDYIILAKKNNLKILPPNINEPNDCYQTINDAIQIPLLIIKQVGYSFYNKILKEYNSDGKFTDIYNFFIRLYKKGLNRKTYEALCFSGALDNFNYNRLTLFNNYQTIVNYLELIKTNEEQERLIVDFTLVEKPDLIESEDNTNYCLTKEYDFLGFYLSSHPIKYLREHEGYENKTTSIAALQINQGFANILISIKRVKKISDKNQQEMAFLDCVDESGEISVTVFASLYKDYAPLLKTNNIVLLNVKLGQYNNKITGVINRIKLVKDEK